uniref:Uncharacterized protein n=1 Tax=Anguilla anguilla TaxID=7936 RepID=A0A0E9QX11_ANGAN
MQPTFKWAYGRIESNNRNIFCGRLHCVRILFGRFSSLS